jgi:hypothetical protein
VAFRRATGRDTVVVAQLHRGQQLNGAALPVGLYAFWDTIMDAPAEAVRERAAKLTRAPHSQAWVPLADD